MPDLTTDRPAIANTDASAAGGDDPFLRLHKMSTTAGVGSGDYVAINGTAVACLLLGLASALVLAGSWVLLIVPLVGVVCGVLAWVQVGHSNGTQTGRGIAAVGLLLCVGLGGYAVGSAAYSAARLRADQNAVIELVREFGKEVADARYQAAYQQCDKAFQNAIPFPQFAGVLARQHGSPESVIGSISGMDWNGLLTFATDDLNGEPLASGMTWLKYSKVSEPVRIPFAFRKVDGRWYIDQIPGMMVVEKPAKPTPTPAGKPQTYGPTM